MLDVGSNAPDFNLSDQNGEFVNLKDFKGKMVVIYFYPKDNTPGCTRESIGFSEKKETFNSKNVIILGVSKDSVKSHANFCKKQNLNITLLSDPDIKMIQDYGVWHEKKNYGKTYMGIVRSTYLIDEVGIVSKVWKNVKVKGHVDKVLEAI